MGRWQPSNAVLEKRGRHDTAALASRNSTQRIVHRLQFRNRRVRRSDQHQEGLVMLALNLVLAYAQATTAPIATLTLAEMPSDLVPTPVEYAVLIAPGASHDAPLLLDLHGGGGDRKQLQRQQPIFERLWSSGAIPPLVVVTPSVTARGFYMDYKDGSERWETFIMGPFLAHLRATLPVSQDPKKTFVMGISMGGMGALRLAFKHPTAFGAVAALEPGIEPILRFEDMLPRHRFWRDDTLFERTFGKPVDVEYWAANHPTAIAQNTADTLRASGLQIYVEAGDLDQFWLYEDAEFLHRVLWDNRVPHEYHLVRGADPYRRNADCAHDRGH
jgi:S-formylglutathione hydrolase